MPKILCVDDDKDILELLALGLARQGFEVLTLSDPQKALAYAAKTRPDLVLLDVMMPVMNGYDLCAALRRQPGTADIPVIFLTALSQEVDKVRALSLGAADFISKPFKLAALAAVLNAHLDKKRAWAAAAASPPRQPAPQASAGSIAAFREFLLAPGAPGAGKPELVKTMNDQQVYQVLAQLGLEPPDAAKYIADFMKFPYLPMINPDDIKLGVLPLKFAQARQVVTLRDDGGTLLVALASPFDFELMDTLRQMITDPYRLAIAEPAAIAALYRISPRERGEESTAENDVPGGLVIESASASQWEKAKGPETGEKGSPIKYITARIIEAAINERASDIHLEPKDLFTSIRFRVDGDLLEFTKMKKDTAVMALTRLKAMAGMDIAEHRRPQDGAFVAKLRDRKFTLRLATTSTNYGESLVMRLVEPQVKPKTLAELGMNGEQAAAMTLLSGKSQGMIIIAGPTGSGKTTTIYSFLSNIDCQRRSLISVEDPIEFRIAQANQQQVNEKAGVTFEALLKSSVRQDPDILFLGEVRDKPSAQIALDFSSTGHLTVTSMHTSNATTAVFRMERLGITRAQIADTVLAVISQRLIKRLCGACKVMRPAGPEIAATFARFGRPAPALTGHNAGCPACRNTGTTGREAVYEIILMTPEVSELIRAGASVSVIRETLRAAQVTLITTSALEKVAKGLVSYDEAYRKVLAEELGASPPSVAEDALPAAPPAALPARPEAEDYIGSQKDVAPLGRTAAPPGGQAKRILIVDDDPDILLLAGKVLSGAGYAVTAVKDGIEALLRLSAESFDLVVSDVDMPDLDGLRLLEILNQKGIKADVVFFTARSNDESEKRGLALGALDYIRKPIKKEILLLRIKNILARRS
jgi:type IV pilus assembly protein PilB